MILKFIFQAFGLGFSILRGSVAKVEYHKSNRRVNNYYFTMRIKYIVHLKHMD